MIPSYSVIAHSVNLSHTVGCGGRKDGRRNRSNLGSSGR